MKHKILIVDDEQPNLRALLRLLSRDHDPFTANSGREALRLLSQHDFSMIISDQRMPEMLGLDFLKKAAMLRPQTVRILLTGYTEVDTLVEAINSGAVYKFLSKPWMNDDLLQVVKRALEHFEAIRKGHGFNHDIVRLNQKLDATREALLSLWTENIKLRSAELYAHSQRIGRSARAISDLLPVEPGRTDLTATAAMLFPIVYSHEDLPDVLRGLPVPDADLDRRSTELEDALQVLSGLQLLDEFNEIGNIIRFANEHFDGTGFPNRLAAESIPLASRIVSAVRDYDLLTRVALDGFTLSHQNAIDHMLYSKGRGLYDPSIVEIIDRIEPGIENPEIVFAPDRLSGGGDAFGSWVTAD